jgi:virulence-associated protein VagC
VLREPIHALGDQATLSGRARYLAQPGGMVYTGIYHEVDVMASAVTARLFKNGRSQAVRLPKEFRFSGDEVFVRREGEAIILEPIKRKAWPRGYWERLREMRPQADVQPMDITLQDIDLDSP